MCGIFGYVNWHVSRTTREILQTLLDGLQRVEYRGYDSAGLCVDSHHPNKPPVIVRSVGNIASLREVTFNDANVALFGLDENFETHISVAHTRWATHGPPAVRNCHPQTSNNGDFIMVHNGIMTNFMAVRQMLAAKGYHFVSDTDTEVMAVFAQDIYAQNPSISFVQLATQIACAAEGAYALLIKSNHYPNELIACRKSSPLVVGIRYQNESLRNKDIGGPCEVYFGSDVNSFVQHTRDVVFLEDGDIAFFASGVVSFYSTNDIVATSTTESVSTASGKGAYTNLRRVSRVAQTIGINPESLSKGAYAHFMLKEIHEQVESVARSMHARVDFETGSVTFDGFDAAAVDALRCSRRLILIACGTSYHSCLAARPIFEELLPEIPISVENAPDFNDRRPRVRHGDVCVFVSQSGETADTLAALQHCKNGGALLIGLTNVPGSSVLRLAHYAVALCAGVEVGVASTKAYTSQIVVLALLAMLLSQEDTSPDAARLRQRRVELAAGLSTLSARIAQCIKSTHDAVVALAEKWHAVPNILILGRGYDYATALESALKVKELSYIYTEGIHSGELKHGPLALVDAESAIIAFCAHDRHFEMSKSAIQQVSARGGRVVAVTTKADDAEVVGIAASCLEVPSVVDCLQVIVNIVPMQLLAYYLALRRGHNVDCPRNLAKSVTVQ